MVRSSTITVIPSVSNYYQVGALAPLIYQVHLKIIASVVHLVMVASSCFFGYQSSSTELGKNRGVEKEQLFVLTDKATGDITDSPNADETIIDIRLMIT